MLTLVLTILMPHNTRGDTICFDIEAGPQGSPHPWRDDESSEETTDYICAYEDPGDVDWVDYSITACKTGIRRDPGSKEFGCMEFGDGALSKGGNFGVLTYGYDALWIDAFRVQGTGADRWKRTWGSSDTKGWCLSKSRNDHLDWKHDNLPQSVIRDECYYQIKFNADGSVEGLHYGEPKLCRRTITRRCNQSCQPGWKQVGATAWGCCTHWRSCGGHRKICQRDTECRRRTEHEDLEEGDETIEFLALPVKEEDGRWVQLAPPRKELATKSSPSDGLVDRLLEAEHLEGEVPEVHLPEAELSEADLSNDEAVPELVSEADVGRAIKTAIAAAAESPLA